MKKFVTWLLVLSLVFSGTVSMAAKEDLKEEIKETVEDIVDGEEPEKEEKEEPEVPEPPIEGEVKILNKPTTSIYQMKQWASQEKYKADPDFIDLATEFYVISMEYGVDPAVTYAQAAKETNFMRYTGVVTKDYHNPCGLKITVGGGDKDIQAHKKFDSWTEGITAQVHHLALYAGHKDFPLKKTPDPRHFSTIYGKAEHVEELGTLWAPSRDYGFDIVRYMDELHTFPISSVTRIAGKDRFETAGKINSYLEIDTKSAVVASGLNFADALTATTLAEATNSKLYLVPSDGVTAELEEAAGNGMETAFLVGGPATVSEKAETFLDEQNVTVTRIAGKDRFETANLIAEIVGGDDTAILSSGMVFADTLAISPVAVDKDYPILLTEKDHLDKESFKKLKEFDRVLILGGKGSVSESIENRLKKAGISTERIAGNNRYETSLMIAERFYDSHISQIFCSGDNFADSLAAVAFADENNGPILLTNGEIPAEVKDYLQKTMPAFTYIIGGENSISEEFSEELKKDVYHEK